MFKIIFTETEFIENEGEETLRENLVSFIYRMKPYITIKVRVNAHSSFKSFGHDEVLNKFNIQLVIGDNKIRTKMQCQKEQFKNSKNKLSSLKTNLNLQTHI